MTFPQPAWPACDCADGYASATALFDSELRLSTLLKRCRARIRPECASLGAVCRQPMRIGKPVTQEEVAEAAGISRQWYLTLENERTHVSIGILTRLADVLMMTPTERATLLEIAVPGLEKSVLQPYASPLEAFSTLRTYSRRLWSASSEREILAIVADEIFTHFERPPLICMALRRADGSWDWILDAGEPAVKNRFAAFTDMLRGILNPEELDELHIYPLLSQPGEVCTDAVFPSLGIFEKFRRAQDAYRFGDWSPLYGRIRSRATFVAGAMVRIPKHAYSAEQRAILSTITLLASLTVS